MSLRGENNFSSWTNSYQLSSKRSIFKKIQINVISSVLWSDGGEDWSGFSVLTSLLPEKQQHCKNEIAEWFNVNRALKRIITIWCIIMNVTKN